MDQVREAEDQSEEEEEEEEEESALTIPHWNMNTIPSLIDNGASLANSPLVGTGDTNINGSTDEEEIIFGEKFVHAVVPRLSFLASKLVK